MSPEYVMHGMYSNKSDVYSFGVLVLEILSGQRSACIKNEENGEDLLTIVSNIIIKTILCLSQLIKILKHSDMEEVE